MDSYTSTSAPWQTLNITKAVLQNGVTSVGNYAFKQCSDLISVTLPESILSIGEGAFCECTSLSEITLPSRISAIAPACFQESGLRQVFIPNNVTIIGDAAFNYCQYLEKVTFPVSLTSIGWSAFNACSSLTDICFYGTKTAWNTIKIADGNNFNDVTIQFNPTSYRITYKYVQSASHTNPEFCEFDKVLTLKNPTRTGYTFGGWYYEEDFSGKKVTSIPKTNREDVTLYAKWTPITYTISFNGNGNKSGEMA